MPKRKPSSEEEEDVEEDELVDDSTDHAESNDENPRSKGTITGTRKVRRFQ